jgi:hypothetical protein
VPSQITFVSVGASVMDRIVLYVSAPLMSYSIGPPLVLCRLLSLCVTSGLMTLQCAPPSTLLNSTFPPGNTSSALVGDTAMGDVQLKRYVSADGGFCDTSSSVGRMNFETPVFRSTRVMEPFWAST